MQIFMKRLFVQVFVALFLVTSISYFPNTPFTVSVEAHSGRTDSNGGHRDKNNVSGLGPYHYHCGGYPAHLHKNGVCPYSSSSSSKSSGNSSSSKTSASLVKKVQIALNKRGYSCGTADGIMGSKTVAALKRFQRDKGLTVDGKIGPQVKKALKIS